MKNAFIRTSVLTIMCICHSTLSGGYIIVNSKVTHMFFVNIHFSYVILSFGLPDLYDGYNLVCIVFTENSIFLSQRLLTQVFHSDLLHMILYVVMVSQAPDVFLPEINLRFLQCRYQEREIGKKRLLTRTESWLKNQ